MNNRHYVNKWQIKLTEEINYAICRKEVSIKDLCVVLNYKTRQSVYKYLKFSKLTLDCRLINLCDYLGIDIQKTIGL